MIAVTQDKSRQFPIEVGFNSGKPQKFTIAASIELRDKLTKAINDYAESVNPPCGNVGDCPVDTCPVYPRTNCSGYTQP